MERKGKSRALRIALVSYDVQELRVWHNYLVEQSPEILCSEYRSGEEVLQVLKQRGLVDVVVLGSELEDMDSMEFLTRMSKLRTKPLLLLQDRRYRPEAAVSAARPDGACYLIQQSSLRDMVQTLLVSRGLPMESPAQFCRRMLSEWGVSPAESAAKYLVDAVAVRRWTKTAARWRCASRSCRPWPSATRCRWRRWTARCAALWRCASCSTAQAGKSSRRTTGWTSRS